MNARRFNEWPSTLPGEPKIRTASALWLQQQLTQYNATLQHLMGPPGISASATCEREILISYTSRALARRGRKAHRDPTPWLG
jgi:hypothetical protein